MNWYNIKKYRPIDPGKYIVHEEDPGYTQTAWLTTHCDGSYEFTDLKDEKINNISHFMRIPPIEIEENTYLNGEQP